MSGAHGSLRGRAAYDAPVNGVAHRSRTPLVASWFAGLAAVVGGPLLARGQLLLLDFPGGPRFPDFQLFPLPSSGELGNDLPLLGLHAFLRFAFADNADKVFLLAPIVVGGLGVAHLVVRRLGGGAIAGALGGTLYVINPFMYDRMVSGQLYFVAGCALLPWASGAVFDMIREPDRRSILRVGLWLAVLAAVDLHVAGACGVMILVALAVRHSRRQATAVAGATAVAIAVCGYWIPRALLASPAPTVTAYDLSAYASRPGGWLTFPNLLALGGFWRGEFTTPAQRIPALLVVFGGILCVFAFGASRLIRSPEHRAWSITLGVGAILGVLVSAGMSTPLTRSAFRWSVDHLFGFAIYREPQKLLVLLTLAYAVGFAIGVERILAARRTAAARGVTVVIAITAVLACGYLMLWGFSGALHLTRYPASWSAADEAMDRQGSEGGALVVPWVPYALWSFSDGRIVANPAPSFFSRPTLVQDGAGATTAPPDVDPFRRYLDHALDDARRGDRLGRVIAPLDVRFVVWLKEIDWWRYGFLKRQLDLERIYDGEGIVVFENTEWEPPPQPVAATDVDASPPLVSRSPGWFPAFGARLPVWSSVGPVDDPFVEIGRRCTDGWRLGDEEPICASGAVATFPSPARPEPLWRPQQATDVVGGVASVATFLVTVLMLRRPPRRDARPRWILKKLRHGPTRPTAATGRVEPQR